MTADTPLHRFRAGVYFSMGLICLWEGKMPGVTQLAPALSPGHAALLSIDTRQALLSACQMNVVEFHTWNSLSSHIEKADRVIFDLDRAGPVSKKCSALIT